MLDFAVADPELDEVPLAAALKVANQLDLGSMFEKLITKELKIKARDLTKLKAKTEELLAAAEKS